MGPGPLIINTVRQNANGISLHNVNGRQIICRYGPLTRYVKLQVAHAPGMLGTFSPDADFKWNRLLAIPACITARAWRTCRDACRDRLLAVTRKTFPAFPAHAHPQFSVSGKRPMAVHVLWKSLRVCVQSSSWFHLRRATRMYSSAAIFFNPLITWA